MLPFNIANVKLDRYTKFQTDDQTDALTPGA